jgi:hypothetical protein
MISMEATTGEIGTMTVAGYAAKRSEKPNVAIPTGPGGDLDMFHIRNIGRMIEDAESSLRGTICDDSFNK